MLRSACSVLMAPPQCEECAAEKGIPSRPGHVCRAGRCIAANRVRRGTAAAVRSVSVPQWGEAAPATRTESAAATGRLEAPPPGVSLQSYNSVAASMKHHLLLHYRLVECNLLVRTSAADPIMNMAALDHSRCDQHARYLWPRKACRRHPAWCAWRDVVSSPTG